MMQMQTLSLVVRYSLFAVIATAVNLLTQELSHIAYSGTYALYVAIAAGTLTGLYTKFILDKQYIFRFETQGIGEHGKHFFLYSFMGVFTTIIFWGFELGFDYLFDTRFMRYTGAVIGLSIGYWVKYQLDKRFVFVRS
jgi:putative flippase GtrA